jgi:flagellin
MLSVNTNYSAMVALQNLNATTGDLEVVQNKISTGLKVAGAKDNGAVYAIAQGQRARVSGLAAVRDGIDRAINVVDSALNAGSKVSDLLVEMKAKAVAAQSEDLSQQQRDAFNGDFVQLRNKINTIVSTATFNGANLIDNTTPALRVLQSDLDTGIGAGNVGTVAGGAKPATAVTPSRSDLMINASEAWDPANTLVANDFVVFTQLGNTYAVQITATTSVQDFIDGVNAASGGRIIASYDDASGVISYQSSGPIATAPFSVDIDTNATATGTARISTFINGATTATTVNAADLPDTRPSSTAIIAGFDLRVGGTGVLNSLLTLDIGGPNTTGATQAAAALTTAMNGLNSNLATLGSQSKALDIQKSFLATLSDTVEKGVSSLVDADLAKESARLQSLQIKQQLGAQALSIANGAPQVLLSLFRS